MIDKILKGLKIYHLLKFFLTTSRFNLNSHFFLLVFVFLFENGSPKICVFSCIADRTCNSFKKSFFCFYVFRLDRNHLINVHVVDILDHFLREIVLFATGTLDHINMFLNWMNLQDFYCFSNLIRQQFF